MNLPVITTIILTYKRPHLLKKAILSCLDQTYPNFKICIYDNASDDETGEIVREFIKKDDRIQYHCHAENIGMMANYQFAMARVDTPYFVLLSDDDIFLPLFFETALKGFEQFPDIAVSICGVKTADQEGKVGYIPMDIWRKEGYFAAREGLAEMVRSPVLPIGALFKHQLVKDIAIDASQEMQLRWDTDYLLQVIARFPFFANKWIGGIFLLHSQGFSTGQNIIQSFKNFNVHLVATKKIIQRLIPLIESFPEIKLNVQIEFDKNLITVTRHLAYNTSSFDECHKALAEYREKYGVDVFLIKSILKAFILKNVPSMVPSIRLMLSFTRGHLKRLKRGRVMRA